MLFFAKALRRFLAIVFGVCYNESKEVKGAESSMKQPYIICHMVTSIDGKVTGDFLSSPACEAATEVYYEINRAYKAQGACGFICGRITMEQSFTGGWYPDLSKYRPAKKEPYLPDALQMTGFYAVAFDPKGKLGWRSAFIEDSDPGYDKVQIIEVLTEQADERYLAYLQELGIPYLFAGKTEINVKDALERLYQHFGIHLLLLEGGSVINGHFLRADCVDELSLVQAPLVADASDKPLFANGIPRRFSLASVENHQSVPVIRYRRHEDV